MVNDSECGCCCRVGSTDEIGVVTRGLIKSDIPRVP